MTLKERLQTETTAAMRSGDALRRDVLRMASNALYMVEKRAGPPARPGRGDRHPEPRGARPGASRSRPTRPQAATDLADKELAEIAILAEFLPAALSDDELAGLVDEAIAATGATSPRDLGKVMGWLAPDPRSGRRQTVSELVAPGVSPRPIWPPTTRPSSH